MSARFARSAFAAARRSATAPTAARAGRRTMATSAEGASKKSDTPWKVGSALVFGPALLYLLSPSGRAAQQHSQIHDDKHDYGIKTHEKHPSFKPTIMKDDEGTPANVAASINLAEQANVPKDDVSEATFAASKAAAEAEGQETTETSSSPAQIPEAAQAAEESPIGKHDRSNEFQNPGDEGPVNMGDAREAALKETPPKAKAESTA